MMTTMMNMMAAVGMFLPAAKPHTSHSMVIWSAAAVCLGLLFVRRKNRKPSR